MFLAEILLVLIFALVLTALLGWGLRWRHPARTEAVWGSVVFLFVVLLLSMWAAAVWLPEHGPVLYGASWLGILAVGLLVSLIILAVSAPSWRWRRKPRTPVEEQRAAETEAVFGCFFWALLVFFVAGILLSLII